MDDVIAHLRQFDLFGGLDDESLRAIAVSCRRRKFPPRTTLFLQDDPGQTMYIILSGSVTIQLVTQAGETVPIVERIAGEVIGEMAILDGKPRSADAITGAHPSEMLMIDREPFKRVMREHPVIALNIIAILLDRFRHFTADIPMITKQDVMGRLAFFILQTANAIGQPGADGVTIVKMGLTQHEIAQRINSSRETVTRRLGELEKMGIIERRRGQLIIRDADRLKRMVTI